MDELAIAAEAGPYPLRPNSFTCQTCFYGLICSTESVALKAGSSTENNRMKDVIDQVKKYQINFRCHARSQFESERISNGKNNWLGIPIVIISSLIGTAIFSTLTKNPSIWWKIGTGLVSMTAASLASLQTFFKFNEQAAKHKVAGAQFEALIKQIDLFVLRYDRDDDGLRDEAIRDLEKIIDLYKKLEMESPDVSDRLYNKVLKECGRNTFNEPKSG
jgi:hypothetical protein